MTQEELIFNILESNKDAIVVGSLGTISYDLKEIEHDNKIIIRGAMGCALGCGLGVALGTDKKVIVLIGDGALLMHLGSIATVLKLNPKNLEVHVFNNGSYKSCGGQHTYFDKIKNIIPFKVHEVSD